MPELQADLSNFPVKIAKLMAPEIGLNVFNCGRPYLSEVDDYRCTTLLSEEDNLHYFVVKYSTNQETNPICL